MTTLSQAVEMYELTAVGAEEASFNLLIDSLFSPNHEVEIEKSHVDYTSRCGDPVSEADIKKLQDSQKSKNTSKNTEWRGKIYEQWYKSRIAKTGLSIPDFKVDCQRDGL